MDNIIIKFTADTTGIEQAVDGYVLLGKVDKAAADQFKAGNAEFAKRTQVLNELDSETKQAAKSIDDLSKNMKQASDVSKSVNENIKQSSKSIDDQAKSINTATNSTKSLKAELKELTAQIAKAKETGGPISVEAVERAGELKDAIGDAQAEIKNLASDTQVFDTITDGAKGIAAGFAIAEGASALFGTGNKELQQSLVKVQGALALLNGLTEIQNVLQKESALRTGITVAVEKIRNVVIALYTGETTLATVATNALNASIAVLTGGATLVIGAIVAGVAAFIAYTKSSNAAADATAALQKEQERLAKNDKIFSEALTKAAKDRVDEAKFQVDLAEKQGKSLEEINRLKQSQLVLEQQLALQVINNTKTDAARAKGQDDLIKASRDRILQTAEFEKAAADKAKEDAKKAADKALKDAIDAEKRKILALKQSLIDQLTGNQLTKQQFDDKIKQLDIKALEDNKDIQKRFGKETVDIEGQIQSAKLGVITTSLEKEAKAKEDAKKRDEDNRKQDLQETINTLDAVSELQKLRVDLEVTDTADAASKKLAIERQLLEVKKDQLLKYGEDVTGINNDIAKKDIEIKIDAEKRKQELTKETLQLTQSLSDTFFNVQKELNSREQEERLNAVDERKEKELTTLDDQLKRQAITQEQYDKKKKQIEDRARAESAAIKRDEFAKQKQASLIQAAINTAVAITAALTATPFSLFNAIAVSIAGAAQIGLIASQPIPKFNKGKRYVTRGLNPAGVDTIPALLNEGERVITTERNSQYSPILDVIHNGLIPSGALNALATGGARIVPVGSSGIDEGGMRRAINGSKVRIENTEEIGGAVASRLRESNYFESRYSSR